MSEKVIEFECVYETAKFSGYVNAEDLDCDDPLHFYDRNLCTQTSLSNAYFEGNDEDKQKLYESFTSDILFVQCLADFQNEKKTLERKNYILHINGGN